VGCETADLVLGGAFRKPGIVVDTHFARLAGRFGWTAHTDLDKIEHHVTGAAAPAGVDRGAPPGDLARPPGLLLPQARLRRMQRARWCPSFDTGPTGEAAAASSSRPLPFRDRIRMLVCPLALLGEPTVLVMSVQPLPANHGTCAAGVERASRYHVSPRGSAAGGPVVASGRSGRLPRRHAMRFRLLARWMILTRAVVTGEVPESEQEARASPLAPHWLVRVPHLPAR
jgi:hypothetical protein